MIRINAYLAICICSLFINSAYASIFSNFDFETTGQCVGLWDEPTKLCPSGYQSYQPDDAYTLIGVKAAHDNNVMTVSLSASGNNYTRAAFSRNISSPVAGDWYKFSVLMKTSSLKGKVRLQILERDAEGVMRSPYEIEGPRGNSSWHKISLIKQIPAGTSTVGFVVMTSTDNVICSQGECGKVYYDNFTVEKLDLPNSVEDKIISNPCDEGEFLSVNNRQCRVLDKQFGFSWLQFNQNSKDFEISLIDCTEQGLFDAVDEIRLNGGGTINLPECVFNLTKNIWMPNNIILQGSGSGKTIIQISNWTVTGIALIRVEVYGQPQRPTATLR